MIGTEPWLNNFERNLKKTSYILLFFLKIAFHALAVEC